MTRPRHSIDGFIPRRPGSEINSRRTVEKGYGWPREIGKTTEGNGLRPEMAEKSTLDRSSELGLSKADIAQSLKSIEDTEPKPRSKRRGLGASGPKNFKLIAKSLAVFILLVGIVVGGFIGWHAISASGNIFKGNIFGLAQAVPLKQDSNGWSNALILGTSEDDEGHEGADLTDSMMVVSVNQDQKKAAMFSIPRDLYVNFGMACNSGYQGKINEYFSCVNSDWDSKEAEQERLEKTSKFVGDIFGLDIQYAAHINNTVLKEAVDAVGGVDVDIQGSEGAPGILDRNFDWRCDYKCYYVKYDNGVHHLDGEHALFLSMARGSVMPTYGLGNSNFDREKNQQKILLALKDKAVSTGTLTNVNAVTGLIDTLGENLRTNVATNEVRTLMKLGLEVPPESIVRISLNDEENPMVKSANYGGASVVMPTTGIFRYEEIRRYIRQQMSASPVTREGAVIAVLNGSGVAGAAQAEADKLEEEDLTVGQVGNAPDDYEETRIFQRTDGMPATKARLESLYGVKIEKETPMPVNGNIDFVIILGKNGPKE